MTLKKLSKLYLNEVVAKGVDKLSTMFLFLLSVIFLSPQEYGFFSLVYVSFFITIGFLANGVSLELARDDKKDCFLSYSFELVLLSIAIAFVLLYLFPYIFPSTASFLNTSLFLLSILLAISLSIRSLSQFYLSSTHEIGKFRNGLWLRAIVKTLAAIIMLPLYKLAGLFLSLIISDFVLFVYALANTDFSKRKLCFPSRSSLTLISVNSIKFINSQVDQIIIGGFLTLKEVAYYNILGKIQESISYILSPLYSIYAGKRDITAESINEFAKKLPSLVLFFFIVNFITIAVGIKFIALLNKEYEIDILLVYLISLTAALLQTFVAHHLLVLKKKEKFVVKLLAIETIINLSLDLLLVPTLRLAGALLATLVATAVMYVYGYYLVSKTILEKN